LVGCGGGAAAFGARHCLCPNSTSSGNECERSRQSSINSLHAQRRTFTV